VTKLIVLSAGQVEQLIKLKGSVDIDFDISIDLGLTSTKVRIASNGVYITNTQFISWEDIQIISESNQNCFLLERNAIRKIQEFSVYTNRHYSLMPTGGAPTMLLSGIPMHRIKGIDPYEDTLNKLRAIKPVIGTVLDTTTGLGYTSIEAAKTSDKVITIELDPVVLKIAKLNPWSQALFNNSKIIQIIGDCSEKIVDFEDRLFTRVIHDPPTLSLAGELYSGEFYRQLYRILKNNGLLFHYIGDLNSKSGHRVAKGASRRLKDAGFRNIKNDYNAYGLIAIK
jgi:predicted methyltransferase